MAVALRPPRMPKTSYTFGYTIAMKQVKAIKIEVQSRFLDVLN